MATRKILETADGESLMSLYFPDRHPFFVDNVVLFFTACLQTGIIIENIKLN